MHIWVSIHSIAVVGEFEVEHYIRAMEQDGFGFDNLCMYACTDKHLIVNGVCPINLYKYTK